MVSGGQVSLLPYAAPNARMQLMRPQVEIRLTPIASHRLLQHRSTMHHIHTGRNHEGTSVRSQLRPFFLVFNFFTPLQSDQRIEICCCVHATGVESEPSSSSSSFPIRSFLYNNIESSFFGRADYAQQRLHFILETCIVNDIFRQYFWVF